MSPPFMPLYVADYLGDTQRLSTEEHGAYLLLLMAMWRAGGRLPNEGKKLARICGLSPTKWARMEGEILGFFDVSGDEIGHKRIEKEFIKYTQTCERRVAAGKRGGKAKALKNNVVALASARDLPEHCQSIAPSPPAVTQNSELEDRSEPSEIIKPQQNGQAVRRGSRLPADWKPEPALIDYAVGEGLALGDIFRIAEDFRDFWIAKNGADASKLDWPATWRRWVREEAKRRANRRAPSTPGKRVGFV